LARRAYIPHFLQKRRTNVLIFVRRFDSVHDTRALCALCALWFALPLAASTLFVHRPVSARDPSDRPIPDRESPTAPLCRIRRGLPAGCRAPASLTRYRDCRSAQRRGSAAGCAPVPARSPHVAAVRRKVPRAGGASGRTGRASLITHVHAAPD